MAMVVSIGLNRVKLHFSIDQLKIACFNSFGLTGFGPTSVDYSRDQMSISLYIILNGRLICLITDHKPPSPIFIIKINRFNMFFLFVCFRVNNLNDWNKHKKTINSKKKRKEKKIKKNYTDDNEVCVCMRREVGIVEIKRLDKNTFPFVSMKSHKKNVV